MPDYRNQEVFGIKLKPLFLEHGLYLGKIGPDLLETVFNQVEISWIRVHARAKLGGFGRTAVDITRRNVSSIEIGEEESEIIRELTSQSILETFNFWLSQSRQPFRALLKLETVDAIVDLLGRPLPFGCNPKFLEELFRDWFHDGQT